MGTVGSGRVPQTPYLRLGFLPGAGVLVMNDGCFFRYFRYDLSAYFGARPKVFF
jgi:hypothetical protein